MRKGKLYLLILQDLLCAQPALFSWVHFKLSPKQSPQGMLVEMR
jgi:hypothetical protein